MPISKSTIKYVKSLRLKKFRQKYNNFIVEGDKMGREALNYAPSFIEAVYALGSWLEAHASTLANDKKHPVTEVELKKLSLLTTPNQVLIVMRPPNNDLTKDLLAGQMSIYLDGIQDPGNMGTILRIADWFGIQTVICSSSCVDTFHPKVIQATMGAFLRVKSPEASLETILKLIPDIPVLGAAMDGINIFEMPNIPKQAILVIGNEGNGISKITQNLITQRIAIPAAANSQAESLNAGVATGIICAVLKGGG